MPLLADGDEVAGRSRRGGIATLPAEVSGDRAPTAFRTGLATGMAEGRPADLAPRDAERAASPPPPGAASPPGTAVPPGATSAPGETVPRARSSPLDDGLATADRCALRCPLNGMADGMADGATDGVLDGATDGLADGPLAETTGGAPGTMADAAFSAFGASFREVVADALSPREAG